MKNTDYELILPKEKITGFWVRRIDSEDDFLQVGLSTEMGVIQTIQLYQSSAIHFTINGDENQENGFKFSFEATGDGWAINGDKNLCPVFGKKGFYEPVFMGNPNARCDGRFNEHGYLISVFLHENISSVSYWLEYPNEELILLERKANGEN